MKTKTTRTALGAFELARHDASITFVCDRCLEPKVAKVRVAWTSTSGQRKEICNGCYGRLLAGAP